MTLDDIATQIRWGEIIIHYKISDGKVVCKIVKPQKISHPFKADGIKGEIEIYKEIVLDES